MILIEFVSAIEEALQKSISQDRMLILVFKTDVGGSVGMALRRETNIQDNYICLDEIELKSEDWIDIGKPLETGNGFPVTVKSLVFN